MKILITGCHGQLEPSCKNSWPMKNAPLARCRSACAKHGDRR